MHTLFRLSLLGISGVADQNIAETARVNQGARRNFCLPTFQLSALPFSLPAIRP
jgi:hypothetical protein